MEGLRPGDPEQVGKYRLLRRLGAGGMGQVFLGQSPSGRLVAVKIIRAELADDAAFRQRFAQEVTAARRVSGMFTAPVVDADPDAPQPWMVTAYVSGPSLADAVTSRGPLPVNSVLVLAAGLAEGLGAVHAAGLVHRDLKPSNVLLASDGPRIIDFGISWASDSASLTRVGGVIGSPGFMSPEQAGGRKVGPASDVFSLGSMLAFASAGDPPFGEGEPSVLLYRVVHEPPILDNVPAELRPLIDRCLAKDPAARPSTDDLLAELGYPEPTEDWLTWLGNENRDTDAGTTEPTGTTEPNLSALPAGVAAAVAGAAAGAAANLVAPLGAPAVSALSEPLAAAPGPANVAAGVASQMSSSSGDSMHNALAFYTTPPPGTPSGAEHSSPGAVNGDEHSSPNGSSGAYDDSSELGALLASSQFDQGSGYLPPNELGPDHRRRRRLLAVVATVVACGAMAVAGFELLSHHAAATGPSHHSTAIGPLHHATKKSAKASAHSSGSPAPQPSATGQPSQVPNPPGGTSGAPSSSPPPMSPGDVVTAYYAAIDSGNWQQAWQLGGDNLYASVTAMQAAFANVVTEIVTVLSVSGNTVLAQLQTDLTTGRKPVLNYTYVVQNSAIVSQTVVTSTRSPPPPTPSASPA